MNYQMAIKDHPADPATPWVAPADYLAAERWLRDYPPTWGEASCSNAQCECGGEYEVLTYTSLTTAIFQCSDCEERDNA